MKVPTILALVLAMVALSLPACHRHAEHPSLENNKIVVTSPKIEDVIITQPYVCQIHSRRHIEIRALQEGYLEPIAVKEGQAVKEKDVMFKVLPVLYKARYEAEKAEVKFAEVKLENTKLLHKQNVVSDVQVALDAAELAKAEAKMKLAEAELNFSIVKAPFDGVMDRLRYQHGSLVKKDDVLTTLSDNAVMWVYFNVPEARYLEYVSGLDRDNESQQIELQLANGARFQYSGTISAIEGKFNNETGNIPFRVDFENEFVDVNGTVLPKLRHGQTGNILIRRTLHNAVIIPQRTTFERLDKQYVWVVGEDNVVHQRLITIRHELEDIFVIKSGLDVKDKIILEGTRQVHEGQELEEYEFCKPEDALKNLKYRAE